MSTTRCSVQSWLLSRKFDNLVTDMALLTSLIQQLYNPVVYTFCQRPPYNSLPSHPSCGDEGVIFTAMSKMFSQVDDNLTAKLAISTMVSAESEKESGLGPASMQASMAGTLKMLVARIGLQSTMPCNFECTVVHSTCCDRFSCYNSSVTSLTDFRGIQTGPSSHVPKLCGMFSG